VHAIVCYGHDGLDELSTVTTSTVYETLFDAHGRREQRMYEFDPGRSGSLRRRLKTCAAAMRRTMRYEFGRSLAERMARSATS